MPTWLPAPVLLFGWISLFTDTASEAIYPLLPLFLTTALGASPIAIGLIEGVAEATASVLKIASGRLSDRRGRRRPWVIAGYGLSSLVRPTMALVTAWGQVLALRFLDRIGKGVRGAPRDAWVAEIAPPDARARVFSFHRSMDHAGAIVGPLAASVFLWVWPGAYRPLFALTIVPGLAVIALLARLPRDTPRTGLAARSEAGGTHADTRRRLPDTFYRALGVVGLFTLGNSTDAYLLLRLGQVSQATALVPLAWSALHVVKASTSLLGGWIADRWGRRTAISIGWVIYALVYLVFGMTTRGVVLGAAFLVYGFYYGLTEGAEKALVADWAPAASRGQAFGLFTAVQGFGALAASIVFGVIWERWSAMAAFTTGAALAVVATVLLFALVPQQEPHPSHEA